MSSRLWYPLLTFCVCFTSVFGIAPDWQQILESNKVGATGIILLYPPGSTPLICAGRETHGGDFFAPTNDSWQTFRRNPDNGYWDQIQTSRVYASPIIRMIAGDPLGSGVPEIIVGTADGVIYLHDPLTGAQLRSFPTQASGLTSISAADLDGDHSSEILVCDESNLFVYSKTGGLLWAVPGVGGKEAIAGQMDADPGMEIACSSGAVLDFATRTVQWQDKYGFGQHLRLYDIDKDGKQELFSFEAWFVVHNFVTAFDVELKQPKWSVGVPDALYDMVIRDLDGDGNPELITSDDGKFNVYDLATMTELRTMTNPSYAVVSLQAGDVDADGRAELVWGTPVAASDRQSLWIGDSQTGRVKWRSQHLAPYFVGPISDDLDGDGLPEIVIGSGSSDNEYSGGRIVIFDGASLRVRAVSEPVSPAGPRLIDLKLRDMDGDGRAEILVVSADGPQCFARAYSFSRRGAFTLKWSYQGLGPLATTRVDAGDIDGDGKSEIVFDEGTQLQIWKSGNGTYEPSWTYGPLPDWVGDLWLEDVDKDGRADIICRTGAAGTEQPSGPILVIDGVSRTVKRTLNVQATMLTARNGALAYTNSTGAVSLLPPGASTPQTVSSSGAPVSGLTLDAEGNLWIGAGGNLMLRRAPSWALAWQTGPSGEGLGRSAAVAPQSGKVRVLSYGDGALKAFTYAPSGAAPAITSVTPWAFRAGDSISIAGSGFAWVSAVKIGGVTVPFHVESPSKLAISVPAGVRSGLVEVVTATGADSSSNSVTVLPAEQYSHTFALAQVGDGEAGGLQLKTTFVLTNPNNFAVDGTVELWTNEGGPLAVRFAAGAPAAARHGFSIPPDGTLMLETSGEGQLRGGGALVSSTAKIGASAVFTLRDATGRMVTEAGVGNGPPSSSQMLPIDRGPDFNTGVAVFNPQDEATNVTLQLLNTDGGVVASRDLPLLAHGHSSLYVTEYFLLPPAFRGALRLTSALPVSATALRQEQHGLTMTTFPVLTAEAALSEGRLANEPSSGWMGAQYQYWVPLLANGRGDILSCKTTIILFNPGAEPASGEVGFTTGPGYESWEAIPGTGEPGPHWFTLEPGGSLFLETDGLGELIVGAGRVQSDRPVGMVALYSAYDGAQLATEAGVFPVTEATEFAVPVDTTEGFDTGIALFNTELKTIDTLRFVLLDESGATVASRLLQPGMLAEGLMSVFVGELFPGKQLRGSLVVVSPSLLSGLAIRMHSSPYFYTTLPRVVE